MLSLRFELLGFYIFQYSIEQDGICGIVVNNEYGEIGRIDIVIHIAVQKIFEKQIYSQKW